MRIWTKFRLTDSNKNIEKISQAITNYLYRYGPISSICKEHGIGDFEQRELEEYTANRVAGLLVLYFMNDQERIRDIVNRYHTSRFSDQKIIPELEGYLEKEIGI